MTRCEQKRVTIVCGEEARAVFFMDKRLKNKDAYDIFVRRVTL